MPFGWLNVAIEADGFLGKVFGGLTSKSFMKASRYLISAAAAATGVAIGGTIAPLVVAGALGVVAGAAIAVVHAHVFEKKEATWGEIALSGVICGGAVVLGAVYGPAAEAVEYAPELLDIVV